MLLQVLGDPFLLCTLGSRLLVNLKEAAELGVNVGTEFKLSTSESSHSTLSEIEFTNGDRNAEGKFPN